MNVDRAIMTGASRGGPALRRAVWISLFAAIFAVACAKDEPKVGTCKVDEGDYIGPNTGYYFQTKRYCATEVECTSHCDRVRGQDDIRACEWDSFQSCGGPLPAVAAQPEVCAVELTIDCGNGPSTSPMCVSCSDPPTGESDYDGMCLKQYASKVGRGTTCDEAQAALAD